MKNSIFQDLMLLTRNAVRGNHLIMINMGGFLSKEQKEQFKNECSELIDRLPEYNGNGYKFPSSNKKENNF